MKPALAMLLLCAACGDDAATDPCGDPLYAGRATDEAWLVMLDAYALAELGAAEAVTVTTPAAAAVVPADGTAPIFAWTSPIAQGDRPHATAPRFAAAPRPRPAPSLLERLGAFFVGSARAHLPPITSDLYYLEIATPGAECPLRVLTTNESWVPDGATWDALRATPGTRTLTITSAYLVENRITEGPYRPAAATTFEVR